VQPDAQADRLLPGGLEVEVPVGEDVEQMLRCRQGDALPLAWAQVRELRSSGMAIGSHTYSHPNLARLSRRDVEDELRKSKDLISNRLREPVDLFAYPFGKPKVHFTADTADAVRATGYGVGAAVIYRQVRASDSLMKIPRLFADGDSLDKLDAKIGGDYDAIALWQEHAPLSVMKLVSPDDAAR
jgi:peptidoglycan/xylan/chitin deacetylase (PgdA/CDA1 family)